MRYAAPALRVTIGTNLYPENEMHLTQWNLRRLSPASLALTMIMFCWSANTLAQANFPNRPVRMVNPYTPGGSVDLVCRAIAGGLAEAWKEQVIVDNRPGAGTQIGSEIIVRAEPDGYSVLCTSSAIAIIPGMYRSMRFDPATDLKPIILATNSASLLVVHPGLPVKTVKDLIALAKTQPGQIAAASSGVGSTTHLKLEMFKSMAQIDLLHVPYKGGAPAITDLIGGQVKAFFNTPGTLLAHIGNGRLRALAITSAQRADYAPDIPTFVEAGVPGFVATIWYGIYGPKHLSDSLVLRWNSSVDRYLRSAQAQDYYRRAFMVTAGGTPASFAAYHKTETARWGAIIKAAGIVAQ
jgi:tripartite-type tricarboxylate transporter receptor subunit TctC